MNKKQADDYYRTEILPSIKKHYESDGIKDRPARMYAYNVMIDGLYRNGKLTYEQANKYCIPQKYVK